MTNVPHTLAGKVAIVTGASRNMGAAFARALAEKGAAVAIHYNSESSQADAEALRDGIVENGGKAITVKADLTQRSAITALFDTVQEQFDRIDIVINNAGLVLKRAMTDVTEDEFDRIFAINTRAAFFVMQEAARRIEDDGRIINTGTTLLGATTGHYSVYAGSKAPLEDFTRALAKEIGSRGVTVNTVAPGPVDTPFFHGEENEQSTAYLKGASPLNRLGQIEDIVPVIDFLASEESRWVTAQTLFVNGGFLAR